jgi:DNA mismatch endonuclease (patch repair protein)
VNGCFWHGHGCKRSKLPTSNEIFWIKKISNNVHRDQRHAAALKALGWGVVTVWECNIEKDIDRAVALLRGKKL